MLIIEAGRTEKHYWADLLRCRELFYIFSWRGKYCCPIQTNGHWDTMGGLAAASDNGGLYGIFW